MKKRNKKQPQTKCIFLQEWGTYTNHTLVAVGFSHAEILRHAKRIGAKQWLQDWVRDDLKSSIEGCSSEGSNLGFFAHKKGASLLYLGSFKGTWEDWEVLMHELHHAVQCILADNKKMCDETEALAYQFEYLFRQVRRKIQKKLSLK